VESRGRRGLSSGMASENMRDRRDVASSILDLAPIVAGGEALLAETAADELIATAQMFDHAARLHSFDLTAGVFREINDNRRRQPAEGPQSVAPAAPAAR
jgi:hypothetical protein